MSFVDNDNVPSAESANLLVKSAIEKQRLDKIKEHDKEVIFQFNECKNSVIYNLERGFARTHCSSKLLEDHLDFFRSKGWIVKKTKVDYYGYWDIVNIISCEKN